MNDDQWSDRGWSDKWDTKAPVLSSVPWTGGESRRGGIRVSAVPAAFFNIRDVFLCCM